MLFGSLITLHAENAPTRFMQADAVYAPADAAGPQTLHESIAGAGVSERHLAPVLTATSALCLSERGQRATAAVKTGPSQGARGHHC